MTQLSVVQPALLSKINERQVLRALQSHGPLSRAEVARHSGISAPTASKAVESLLRAGLLEEGDAPELARGRPGKKLRLASTTAQVLALVIDAEQCRLVSAGLDGVLHEGRAIRFPTPPTYAELIQQASDHAERLMAWEGVTALGMAISIPGLLDYRYQRSLLSPNLPITNAHSPSQDLAARLEIPCIMVQESHALCLAERHFGAAQSLDHFAVMDVSTGVGLGVMSGGRLLTGNNGLAGELGHITVQMDGRQCGCGNTGCLETVASDSAFAWRVSQHLGRRVSVADILEIVERERPKNRSDNTSGSVYDTIDSISTNSLKSIDSIVGEALEETIRYLAIGVAAAINLFNPANLFIHGKLFEIDPTLFGRLVAYTGQRALSPAFADCCIVQARGSKRQGAIAAIIDHLTDSVVPEGPGVGGQGAFR